MSKILVYLIRLAQILQEIPVQSFNCKIQCHHIPYMLVKMIAKLPTPPLALPLPQVHTRQDFSYNHKLILFLFTVCQLLFYTPKSIYVHSLVYYCRSFHFHYLNVDFQQFAQTTKTAQIYIAGRAIKQLVQVQTECFT